MAAPGPLAVMTFPSLTTSLFSCTPPRCYLHPGITSISLPRTSLQPRRAIAQIAATAPCSYTCCKAAITFEDLRLLAPGCPPGIAINNLR